jgi:RNA polymerase sigma factor (TIGR02999 family)
MNEVTRILNAVEQGDKGAIDQLVPALYQELRQLAAFKLSREKPGQTLQPTALVHEAYLRLAGQHRQASLRGEGANWKSRTHFFAAAAEAMRRILIENARRKHRLKRGAGLQRVDLSEGEAASGQSPQDLIAVDEALSKLAEIDKTKAELVKLRYFAGLTLDQAADVLGISPTTAKRHWTYARAWLYKTITSGQ